MKGALQSINHWLLKKRLTSDNYNFLFDDEPAGEVVVLDTETTGLDPKKASLLSIGAVKLQEDTILLSERFELLVKPTVKIDEKSITIHHLRHCDVENGVSETEAVDAFVKFLGSAPLVGYYIDFDKQMIDKVFRTMSGIPLPNRTIEISGLYYDYKIGRIPQGNVDLRFDSILDDLKLPRLGKHDALNDAIMTALI